MRDTAAGSRLLTRLPYSEMIWALQEMLKEDRPRNHPQVVRQGDRSETGGRAVPVAVLLHRDAQQKRLRRAAGGFEVN